jgi:multiple sugar transport system permease protein
MKNKFDALTLIKYLILFVLVGIVLIPLSVIVLSSFKTRVEITQNPMFSLPHSLMLDNYIEVYKKADILLALKNTAIITCTSVALNIIFGAMVSYILARFEFKFKKVVLSSFMVAMIIPFTTIEVARFSIIKNLGLFNTYWAPILIYVGADLIQIYVYKQFIDKIPVSLDESAMMDGASYFTIFTRIIFPLVVPASLTIAIIKFVEISNDMYTPYLYIPSDSLRTLTTALMIFQGERTLDWGKLSAGVIFVMAPSLIIYFVFQKYIFAGLVAGASKE